MNWAITGGKAGGTKYIRNREAVIWGCGKEGVKLFLEIGGVRKVFDNYKTGKFLGVSISSIVNEEHIDKYFILVSTAEYYQEIKKQLEVIGLEEFEDFIPVGLLNRDLCVVHGNCYRTPIAASLQGCKEFSKRYYIYDTKPIYELGEDGLDKKLLSNCDLFIHQDIRADNMFGYRVSDEYAKSILRAECLDITIPNLVGLGNAFFPQSRREGNTLLDDIFPFRDKAVDKMLDDGWETDVIVEHIISGSVYTEEFIVSHFKEYIKKFRERETRCDIRIMDYIEKNYQTEKLFYDDFHPTNAVLYEMVTGILRVLRIDSAPGYLEKNMGEFENVIYPEVKAALKIKWEQGEVRSGYHVTDKFMDIEEYIRQYIRCVKQVRQI